MRKSTSASEKEGFCQKKCCDMTKVWGHSKSVSLRKNGRTDKKNNKKKIRREKVRSQKMLCHTFKKNKQTNKQTNKNPEIFRVTFFLMLSYFTVVFINVFVDYVISFLSLKSQISVIWLVKTKCIFLIFFILTVQISMECIARKIETGKNNQFGKQEILKNSKQFKPSSVITYSIYNTYNTYK